MLLMAHVFVVLATTERYVNRFAHLDFMEETARSNAYAVRISFLLVIISLAVARANRVTWAISASRNAQDISLGKIAHRNVSVSSRAVLRMINSQEIVILSMVPVIAMMATLEIIVKLYLSLSLVRLVHQQLLYLVELLVVGLCSLLLFWWPSVVYARGENGNRDRRLSRETE